MSQNTSRAYVVAVDMGYGHQRAAYPLRNFATLPEGWSQSVPIISANSYRDIPFSDRLRWNITRKTYEFISRIQGFPFFGRRLFRLMDAVEHIEPFYPRHDLSAAPLPLIIIRNLISGGFGKHLIDSLNKNPLPLITTFPLPAFMAEEHGYKGDIYCLCTDTDVSRLWVSAKPEHSRIKYLAPTVRVKERLKLYGVMADNIIVCGFPLPLPSADNSQQADDVLKETVRGRIQRLDPQRMYRKKYEKLISLYVGSDINGSSNDKPLSIVFAIGGAGAQRNIAISILKSLRWELQKGTVKLTLVVGTSLSAKQQFEAVIRKLELDSAVDKSVQILYSTDKYAYFQSFNDILSEADILWTKPSELSFYAALGIPIVMTPPLGPQEECNRSWIHMVGAGFEQYAPEYANEWLFDWLKSGWLAEAAMSGYINAPKHAVKHIEDIVLGGKRSEIEHIHFV